jgi:hypothetical protein
MNRLQRELHRLYGPLAQARPGVRAAVLELGRPADWATLGAVWASVQADWALPAPAIAVNGVDGMQLWFSFEAPVPAHEALAWLEALRQQHLGHIAPARVVLRLVDQADASRTPEPACPVPALQAGGARWSAFVAQDLAQMFAEEPWLDMPPNPEGQAQLLAGLHSIRSPDWEAVLPRLAPPAGVAAATLDGARMPVEPCLDPRRFLLDVMNNPNLEWSLRIEAAKALLP